MLKKPDLASPSVIRLALQQQAVISNDTRLLHRLHALLLIENGQTCQQVAELFGEDRRTIQRWIGRFESDGVEGLQDGAHGGRPATLNEKQWKKLNRELAGRPKSAGVVLFRWDGKLLVEHLREKYGVTLGLRQCQRILREFRQSHIRPRG